MVKNSGWWKMRASFIHNHRDREETFVVQDGYGHQGVIFEKVHRLLEKKYPKVTAWAPVGGIAWHDPKTNEDVSQIVDREFDGTRVKGRR